MMDDVPMMVDDVPMMMDVKRIKIELVANDLAKYRTSQAALVKFSGLIKDMIDEQEDEPEEDEILSIPVPNLDSRTLRKIIEYMEYHFDNPDDAKVIAKPIKLDFGEVVSAWDLAFIDVDDEVLVDLMMGANYLNIQELLDLSSAKLSTYLKGKTTEQTRATFNLVHDFADEEEAGDEVEAGDEEEEGE